MSRRAREALAEFGVLSDEVSLTVACDGRARRRRLTERRHPLVGLRGPGPPERSSGAHEPGVQAVEV
jgi:hypothetical protein